MSRWFRFYDDAINDPKVLRMPEVMRWHWVAVLCIASKSDGVVKLSDVPIYLRVNMRKAEQIVDSLKIHGLLDEVSVNVYTPHNWNGRQYKSDVSTDRVQQFRKRKRNVSSAVSETPPETEADTESDQNRKKGSQAVAKATRPSAPEVFEEFWKAYPKRDGSNPKAPARKKFETWVKSGADPQAIIAAARRYAAEIRDRKDDRRFVAQAITWLNQQRWEDHQPPPNAGQPMQAPAGAPTDEELRARYGQPSGGISTEAQADNPERSGADHVEKLRREGAQVCPNLRASGVSNHQPRHSGMQRLGALLPEPLERDTLCVSDASGREDQGDDGPDAVARVV